MVGLVIRDVWRDCGRHERWLRHRLGTMRAVVTGAGGFLGEHLLRALLEGGHQVTALLRPGGSRPICDVPCEEADLAGGAVPAGVFGGADVVFHLAALYSEGEADTASMRAVNVGGTEAVLDAAARADVSRVVHCSTMGTCAPVHGEEAITERGRPDPSASSPYHRTKLEAEDLALRERRLEVVVVNPAAPVGAFDRRPTVTGARILDILEGRWPRLLQGPVNHVCAAACVRGMVLAAEKGTPGERYLLGGEDLGPDELLRRVARAAGSEVPRRPWLWRLRGKGRPAPGGFPVDDRKARRELGHDAADLDAAFVSAVDWFRSSSRS